MPRTFTQLYFHIVFATHQRRLLLTASLAPELYRVIGALLRDHGGVLVAAGGMPDHVHLLVSLRAHPSLSEIVKTLKGTTSRWLNEAGRCHEPFGWQEGYAAFSVSASALGRVRTYVENQVEHHRSLGFEAELAALLEKHGLASDAT
jgi:putative transposase